MFEGKNVIFIMMESVGELIINEEYFPNFYKMYNEGWVWTNNYSPRNSCATGNNEMSGKGMAIGKQKLLRIFRRGPSVEIRTQGRHAALRRNGL